MQPKTPKLLEDIRDAAAFIADVTRDATEADYQHNRMLRQSVERNFEIIGEAMRRMTQNDPTIAKALADTCRSSLSAISSSTATINSTIVSSGVLFSAMCHCYWQRLSRSWQRLVRHKWNRPRFTGQIGVCATFLATKHRNECQGGCAYSKC